MQIEIIIASFLFGLSIAAYYLLSIPAWFGFYPLPRAQRLVAISMLVNCLSQVFLITRGSMVCTVIFLCATAVEACVCGLRIETFLKDRRNATRSQM